jgi:DNA (cytosine-5)-methyltransferase 1
VSEQCEKKLACRTSVELFAGGGGLARAVHNVGFRPLLFNEFAKRACETLVANGAVRVEEGEKPWIPKPDEAVPLVEGDVRELDMTYLNGENVDLLAGGPPCQPFSLGGIAKGDEDDRNMFPQMFKAVRQIQPKAVICENVYGLLRPSFKPYFDYIQRELKLPFVRREGATWREHNQTLIDLEHDPFVPAEERYEVVKVPVNAADYGVPQIRKRVILVAFRSDLGVDVAAFDKFVKNPPFSETALVRSIMLGRYWQQHPEVPDHVREHVWARLPKELPPDDGREPWRTLRDAIKGFRDGEGHLPEIPLDMLDRKTEHGGDITYHVGWPDARIYDGHTPNELDRPAKTVKAGVHGVPGGESVMLLDQRVRDESARSGWRYLHRYMTVRETARVMTFPDTWKLEGPRGEKMRQLGNAVPVLLGEFFARAVGDALDTAEGCV